jgi:hypothetical protein
MSTVLYRDEGMVTRDSLKPGKMPFSFLREFGTASPSERIVSHRKAV